MDELIKKIATKVVSAAKDLSFDIQMEANLTPISVSQRNDSFSFYVKAKYGRLESVFGSPIVKDQKSKDKTRVLWVFKINNDPNLKFSIYDYKDGETPIEDIKEFHVGTKNAKTSDIVKKILDLKNIKYSD